MDRPLKETVYSPDSELLNFGKLMRSIWRDLLASRELAWRLSTTSNIGIAASESKFVLIHDDDDSWEPQFRFRKFLR